MMENGIIRTLDSSTLTTIDQLVIVVGIIIGSSLGSIQYIKETPFFKRKSKRFLTLLVFFIVTLLNTYFVHKWVTDFSRVFLLAISLGKIGYDAFIEGIPNYIKGRFAALSGGVSANNNQRS